MNEDLFMNASMRAGEQKQQRSYQHEVDVEIKDLVTHVHAEVVAEVISQVGECTSRTLEMCARYFHALNSGKTIRFISNLSELC